MTETFQKKEYVQSQAVTQAQKALEDKKQLRPGEYVNQYASQLSQLQNRMGKTPFRYDLKTDGLYQQYKDAYIRQGRQAMQDTMGRAATLTGGYGNTYAQTAGQQTYQGYLQGLNDKVPQLYQLAMDKYRQDEQALRDEYELYADAEKRDYARYRDSLGDYLTELNRLQSIYDSERDFDYGRFADEQDFDYTAWNNDRNFAYRQSRDAVADDQWLKNYLYQQERDAIADEHWERNFEENVRQFQERQSAARASSGSRSTGKTTVVTVQQPQLKEPTNSRELSDTLAYMRKTGATQSEINLAAGNFYQKYGKYA